MIVLIVIGWTVVLPLCVVLGLFCASRMLGRRARAAKATGGTDMQPFSRQFSTVPDNEPPAPATEASQRTSRSVSAGY
jgi:hypothetical protein